MRRYTFPYLAIVFCCLLWANSASAAAPAAAHECEACHGPNGVSPNKDIPIIAGMSAFYLDGEIQAYQKGLRPCPKTKYPQEPAKPATDMCTIAKKLSPADMSAVDNYFASQQFVAAVQTTDPKAAALGKQIHADSCELCHTEGGSVSDDDAGILAGQWMPYLQEAFKEFQSGKRKVPEKMKPKLASLTPDKINALIQYYGSEGKK